MWSQMWSTSVAGVRTPRWAHSRQNGSRRSWPGRRSSVQIFSEYQRCHAAASGDLGRACGLCAGQYPSRVKAPQPGCRQGRSGFIAIGLSPPEAKIKTPEPTTFPSEKSLALALNALALVNIQDDFTTAGPAIDLQISCHGVWSDFYQMNVPLADRTGNPSVLYDQFITIQFHRQPSFLILSVIQLYSKVEIHI